MKTFLFSLAFACLSASAIAADKNVIFIAGPPSHGPGAHEHNAGCLLLKKCLDSVPGVHSAVYKSWPDDPNAFNGVDTVIIYSDGQGSHPALREDHLQILDGVMKKGAGLVLIHYAVEPTIERGEKEFLNWVGGCFEVNWSVNPFWKPEFKPLPKHPITRGVKPFQLNDEWYFHMRFADQMKGVTPILSAVAPESTMSRPDGLHEGNPAVREAVKRGEPQHVAWAYVRPDGGRGFAFTGGHAHANWGNDDVRRLVLNAILWTAKANVPKQGVASSVTADDLAKNLDPK